MLRMGCFWADVYISLRRVCTAFDHYFVNLALCWCLKNKNVSTVILGASKVEQLKQNLRSPDQMNIVDDSVMDKIDSILKNKI